MSNEKKPQYSKDLPGTAWHDEPATETKQKEDSPPSKGSRRPWQKINFSAYLGEGIKIILTALISIGVTTYIITTYFYRPIVVIDLTALVTAERNAASQIADDQERVKHIAKFFDKISDDIKKRKEIVLVKEAIVNPEQFTDITNEYRTKKYTDIK